MNREEIKKKIRETLIDHRWVEPRVPVKEESNYRTDFGMDSIDIVELVMDLQRDYGVSISDEEVERMGTVKDSIDLIEKKLKEQTTQNS